MKIIAGKYVGENIKFVKDIFIGEYFLINKKKIKIEHLEEINLKDVKESSVDMFSFGTIFICFLSLGLGLLYYLFKKNKTYIVKLKEYEETSAFVLEMSETEFSKIKKRVTHEKTKIDEYLN
jgi:hypothetical protein